MSKNLNVSQKSNTNNLVKIGLLSAIGYILMFISVPLPFLFPDFLKLDISDLPVLLGTVSMGPISGILISFLKNLLQFITGMSANGGIGEFANFLIGVSLVIGMSFTFKVKNKSNLIKSLIIGVIFMTFMGCITNYLLILPFYETIMPIEAVISLASEINPIIKNKTDFIIWMIVPFNLLKGSMISLVTVLVYEKIKSVLN